MDKASITVVASHFHRQQSSIAAGLNNHSGELLVAGDNSDIQRDVDAEIASKCQLLGQQSNLQLMQNALQMQQW